MAARKTGDILIFKAGDDWVGKSIAWLTRSDVSHAAMQFSSDSMVEMGANGISVSATREAENGEEAYVLRLDPEKDPAPLVKAAQAYVDNGIRFDYPDLVILAGLLIYRSVRPTVRWRKITDLILDLACCELDKILNKLLHKNAAVPAMVCSQLVYQCYFDCGPDYAVVLKNALLQDAAAPGTVCLASFKPGAGKAETPAVQIPVTIDLEVLAKELYEALWEAEDTDETQLQTVHLAETAGRAAKFLDFAEKILQSAGIDLPVPAMFVTPCDLLEHAVNLKRLGTVKIERIRGN